MTERTLGSETLGIKQGFTCVGKSSILKTQPTMAEGLPISSPSPLSSTPPCLLAFSLLPLANVQIRPLTVKGDSGFVASKDIE